MTLPKASSLTQKRLQEVLSYNARTGVFTWKHRPVLTRMSAGKRAGNVNKTTGYRIIWVDGTRYRAARLAWLYVHGCWPVVMIDHINGIRDDDRLINLREATKAQNNQNRKGNRNNTSGVHGVQRVSRRKGDGWVVQLKVNGKRKHVGIFDTKEEASAAYLAARAETCTFQPEPR